jgi:dihydroorotase
MQKKAIKSTERALLKPWKCTRLVKQGKLELAQGIAKLSSEPAKILGINSAALAVGDVADICIFDPEKQWQINAETWQSQGHNTPYWQEDMLGKVTHTIQAGKIIYS